MDEVIKRVAISTDFDIPESVLKKFCAQKASKTPTYVLDEDSFSSASTDEESENDDGFESSRSSSRNKDGNDWKNNRERIGVLEENSKQHDKGLLQLAHNITSQEKEHHQYDEALFTLAKEIVANETCAKVQKAKIDELHQRLNIVETMYRRITTQAQAPASSSSNGSARVTQNATTTTATGPPTFTISPTGNYICNVCMKEYRSKPYFPKHKCLPLRN